MRKSILLSAMLLVSTFAFAQIQKGQMQISGMFNFIKQETGSAEVTNFNFVTGAGYFMSDLTSVGLLLNISSNKSESSIGESKRNLFEFGVFTRFHKSIADKLYLYLEPSLSFGSGEISHTPGGSSDLSTTLIQFRPGVMYVATPKISLVMGVGSVFYNNVKETNGSNEVTSTSYGLIINPANVNLGVSLFL